MQHSVVGPIQGPLCFKVHTPAMLFKALHATAFLTLRFCSDELTHVPRHLKSVTTFRAGSPAVINGGWLIREDVRGDYLGFLCLKPETNLGTLCLHSGQELLCLFHTVRYLARLYTSFA